MLEVGTKAPEFSLPDHTGKPVMAIERSTYLIDENGIIAKAFGKVKPKDNAKQMLKELS